MNIARLDEISKEISAILKEQEEVEHYTKKLQQEEEQAFEYLQNIIFNISDELEACQGDREIRVLVERKYLRIQEMQRKCMAFCAKLQEDKKKYRYRCESEIEALKLEKQRLTMGGI